MCDPDFLQEELYVLDLENIIVLRVELEKMH
jgi:hypothetical protein